MNGRPNTERIALMMATTTRSQWYALPFTNLFSGLFTIAALIIKTFMEKLVGIDRQNENILVQTKILLNMLITNIEIRRNEN